MAESVLGPRNASKKIYQPKFFDDIPRIAHTPTLDGAFVLLAKNAETRWDLVLFQMAHETVHLLNPIVGEAKILEEGVATEFSYYSQSFFANYLGTDVYVTDLTKSYIEARNLVSKLPGGPINTAKRIREVLGSLDNITPEALKELFPDFDMESLHKLNERFKRDC